MSCNDNYSTAALRARQQTLLCTEPLMIIIRMILLYPYQQYSVACTVLLAAAAPASFSCSIHDKYSYCGSIIYVPEAEAIPGGAWQLSLQKE
jgi:hypothetical protein